MIQENEQRKIQEEKAAARRKLQQMKSEDGIPIIYRLFGLLILCYSLLSLPAGTKCSYCIRCS